MNISHKSTGSLEKTRFEKIHSVIFNDSKEASIIVAKEIASFFNVINSNSIKISFWYFESIGI